MIEKSLSYEDYRKRPGVNASLLKTVDRYSLAHAKHQLDGGTDEETDAKALGTSFHALLLEGRVDYAVHPATYGEENKPWNWNANLCKQWAAEQKDRTVLSEKEAKSLEAMVESAHRALGGILKGERELSVFAEKDGLPVKCRVDYLPADEEAPIIDFKTTTNAEYGDFLKQSLNLRYHLQCAWLLDVLRWAGMPRKSVWLVGIETAPPYATCILRFHDRPLSFLRVGRTRCRAAFQKLKNAYETGMWPDYGQADAEDHAMPWLAKELEATA